MKKIMFLASLLVCSAALFVSCGDDDPVTNNNNNSDSYSTMLAGYSIG